MALLFTVCAVNLVAASNYDRDAMVNPIEEMIDRKQEEEKMGVVRRLALS